MAEAWRPRRTRDEAVGRAVQSMVPGSMRGRVATARQIPANPGLVVEQTEAYDLEDQGTGEIYWEDDDSVTLKQSHLDAGEAPLNLSYVPLPESFLAWWFPGGEGYMPMPQTDYDLNASGQTCTFPLGAEAALDDVIRVRYPYSVSSPVSIVIVPFEASGWRWKEFPDSDTADRFAPGFDDSAWVVGKAAFSDQYKLPEYSDAQFPPHSTTLSGANVVVWMRRNIVIPERVTEAVLTVRRDGSVKAYLEGNLVIDISDQDVPSWPAESTFTTTVAVTPGTDLLLAVRLEDDLSDPSESLDATYIDIEVIGHS